jgi:hypothetical protein
VKTRRGQVSSAVSTPVDLRSAAFESFLSAREEGDCGKRGRLWRESICLVLALAESGGFVPWLQARSKGSWQARRWSSRAVVPFSAGVLTHAAGDAASRPCIAARSGFVRHLALAGSLANSRRA